MSIDENEIDDNSDFTYEEMYGDFPEQDQLLNEYAGADEERKGEIKARLDAISLERDLAEREATRASLIEEATDRRNPPTDERRNEIIGEINELDGQATELSEDLPEGDPLPYSTDREYGRVIAMADTQAKKDLADVRAGRVPVSDVRRARIEELASLRDTGQHDEAVQRIHNLVTVSRDEIDFTAQGNPAISRQVILPDGGVRFENTSDLGMVTQVDYTPDEIAAMGLNASNGWGTRPAPIETFQRRDDFMEAVIAAANDPYRLRQIKEANPQQWAELLAAQSDEMTAAASPSVIGLGPPG